MKNLFIIGAQRSGSTYLYQALDSHPQVSMLHPVRPEPKFFMSEQQVARGCEHYEQTCFVDRKPETRYLGEKSTSYIESLEAARRIKTFYPDARILMILRDPVFRAYSNYRFSVANKLESLSFSEALAAESERLRSATFATSVSPHAYRKRGRYMDYIERWLEVFDASQFCVLIFEEFVNDLANVQRLYGWLGVEQDFVPPSLNEVVNPAIAGNVDQQVAFRDLALGYRDSIVRLEGWLGRRIEAWGEHHRTITAARA
jgi:hypothetical protein